MGRKEKKGEESVPIETLPIEQQKALKEAEKTGVLLLVASSLSNSVNPVLFSTPNLTTVDLSGNPSIGDISAVFRVPTLVSLNVDGCTQLGLESGLPNEPHGTLESLSASACSLRALPPAIGKWTSLKRLSAPLNSISALPKEFSALQGLAAVDLSGNMLAHVPAELVAAVAAGAPASGGGGGGKGGGSGKGGAKDKRPSSRGGGGSGKKSSGSAAGAGAGESAAADPAAYVLERINLSGNAISVVPAALLSAARDVDVSYNRVSAFAGEVAACPGLERLCLAGNPISSVEGIVAPPSAAEFARRAEEAKRAAEEAAAAPGGPAPPTPDARGKKQQQQQQQQRGKGGAPGSARSASALADAVEEAVDPEDAARAARAEFAARFPALRELDVSRCILERDALSRLDVSHLAALETLIVSGNAEVAGLPAGVESLQALRALFATECDIAALPENIGDAQSLETIEVGGNTRLSSLPASVASLALLENLGVEVCPLSNVPGNIARRGGAAVREHLSRAQHGDDASGDDSDAASDAGRFEDGGEEGGGEEEGDYDHNDEREEDQGSFDDHDNNGGEGASAAVEL